MLNPHKRLSHPCPNTDCSETIILTLESFTTQISARCPEGHQPVVYGGSGPTAVEITETVALAILERHGWTLIDESGSPAPQSD